MTATRPTIISRPQWGADPVVTPAGSIALPTPELWLHHTAGEQFDAAGMRMLQAFTLHRQDEHYVDLEYTFVLDHVDCNIFESRGPGRNSAATFDHNSISHAICVMGNFQTDPVSALLVHVLANLVAWGHHQGWWPLAITGGHHDASNNSTLCPGFHMEAVIPLVNALAAQIHAQGSPPPMTPNKPEYSPPVNVLGGIASALIIENRMMLAGPLGHIYTLEGDPLIADPAKRGPIRPDGTPKAYWVGQQIDELLLPTAADVKKQPSVKYVVTSLQGGRFMYPDGG